MSNNNKGNIFRYMQVAVTFGITTALRIYLLGVLIGGWLDKKFDSSPWFMLLGVLLAIFLSFKFLLDQTAGMEKNKSNTKEK
ncbi:AtpZ/AtpI family protein [Dehalobacterium formicoaceticum]|uniref:AtpZ/AtpI family protein n=1 Tax=Dehalobacterium formicoaceticum TaxID=51515 RepID=A0ABT1Y4K4_9FIRM|nr:AtpZ/AtpI family protein [Dehalobacterium formicoaceticum]MCR6545431.1 AtpZ/AtpI family protein [Dehalobacterium formicoaceticum]